MSISPRFLQELRDRVTLSEVINRRVKLTRAGREYKGCCPFHKEKTPSFYVNDDKQFFHCFGCGAHGDVLGFTMQHDNLSFIEAVQSLAAQAGLQVPDQSPQEIERDKKQKSLYSLCEDAAKWFEAQLYTSKHNDVLTYISGRGLSVETIASFRLGYAPAEDQALRTHLTGLGYTDAQMLEAAIIKPSSKGGAPYAFFRDRLMFPVMDIRGRVVAFSGRVLPEHLRPPRDASFKPPKYINTSDTPLFHKGRNLYAQQHARMNAAEHPVLVVEGQMDVIACHQAGFRGAVAPLGTALTEDQIVALWKMIPKDIKEPVLCFDGDNAGYRAALRASERVLPLLKANHSVRIAFLPEGEDPDTYIQGRGKDAFKALVDQSLSLLDFLWTHYTGTQRHDTPESKAGLQALLEDLVKKIPDAQIQYHYRQAFRDKSRTLFGSNFQPFAKGRGGKVAGPAVALPPVAKIDKQDLYPRVLLLTLLNHPYLYPYVQEQVLQISLSDPALVRIFETALSYLEDIQNSEAETGLDRESLMLHLNSSGLQEGLERLMPERLYVHAGFSRPGAERDKVMEGWKSIFEQWDKEKILTDLRATREAYKQDVTPENESRSRALQDLSQQIESEAG